MLKEVVEAHRTFLKGVADTVTSLDVRMASSEVGIATIASNLDPFTTPDGVKHPMQQQRRTFVVVKRGSRWLVMQGQNTFITQP